MSGQVQVCAGGVCGLGYQVVWCPRYRWPVLGGRAAGRCEELIEAEAAGRGRRVVALEIVADHVHLFVKAHLSDSPSRVASQFKGFTLRYLRAELAHRRSWLSALWSGSYLATVGAVPTQMVRRYTGTYNERPWRKVRAL